MPGDGDQPRKRFFDLRSWGFTPFERVALLVFVALILAGSAVRYYQGRRFQRGMELMVGKAQTAATLPASDTLVIATPLDINTATVAELETLPGIGPVRAAAILEYRNTNGSFQSLDQLVSVPGIGEKTVERLKGLVICRDEK